MLFIVKFVFINSIFFFFIFQSSDTGDTKDLQRKLDQAVKEVEEYKSKYEKLKKVITRSLYLYETIFFVSTVRACI